MRNHANEFTLLLSVLLLVGIIGCGPGGPETVPVEGKVLYQGEPVPGLEVVFTPDDGTRPSYGMTDESGNFVMTYTIDKMGVKPGKHGVTFNWEASPEMPGKPDSVVAVLEEHGPQGTPYEVEVTEGVEDMVIDIE